MDRAHFRIVSISDDWSTWPILYDTLRFRDEASANLLHPILSFI